ncbi:hypothetical protein DMUE_5657, partial [Dictyocoela muelleri]
NRCLQSVEDVEFILHHYGFLNKEYICKQCNGVLILYNEKSRSGRYYCTHCKRKYCIKNILGFEDIGCSLNIFFGIFFCFINEYKIKDAANELSLSSKFIQKYYTLLRTKIKAYINSTFVKLGNEGIVEIDETLISRRKYNRGRFVEQQWLFGAIERNAGNVFLNSIKGWSKAVLKSVIAEAISENSIIFSDEWSAYKSCFHDNTQYIYCTVNNTEGFFDSETGVHTQCVEIYVSIRKSF